MQYAIFDGTKIIATPKANGVCPGCGAELLARCGTKNIWHWAHKGRRHCDPWWENETAWHREWKNHFPVEWQEVSSRDEKGEQHIADVKTPNGQVIEFQHSPIAIEEVRIRTKFHKPMIWVVDGTRRVNDFKQFKAALDFPMRKYHLNETVFELDKYSVKRAHILRDWFGLDVPVVFDFGGEIDDSLGPGCKGNHFLLVQQFVEYRRIYRRRSRKESSKPRLRSWYR